MNLSIYKEKQKKKMPLYREAASKLISSSSLDRNKFPGLTEALAEYMYKYFVYIDIRKESASRILAPFKNFFDKLFIKLGRYRAMEQVALVDMGSTEETLKHFGLETELEKARMYVLKENQQVVENLQKVK